MIERGWGKPADDIAYWNWSLAGRADVGHSRGAAVASRSSILEPGTRVLVVGRYGAVEHRRTGGQRAGWGSGDARCSNRCGRSDPRQQTNPVESKAMPAAVDCGVAAAVVKTPIAHQTGLRASQ